MASKGTEKKETPPQPIRCRYCGKVIGTVVLIPFEVTLIAEAGKPCKSPSAPLVDGHKRHGNPLHQGARLIT